MAFGKHKEGDDISDRADVRAADDINDVDDLEGPFDVDDFDDPDTAALARLDLGPVLIPVPEAGQEQDQLTRMGPASAAWVATPTRAFPIARSAAPQDPR